MSDLAKAAGQDVHKSYVNPTAQAMKDNANKL